MKRRWHVKMALAAAVAVLLLIPVVAQAGPGHGPGGGPGMIARMVRDLGLTEDQQTKILAILEKYRTGSPGERMEALHQAHMDLEALIQDPATTDDQVQQAAGTVSTQAALVAADRHHMAVEIDAVLTADQRTKAAEIRQQRQAGEPGPPPEGGPF